MKHIIEDSAWFGNPQVTACWQDESLNRILAEVARGVHDINCESDTLARFAKLNDSSVPPPRGRKRRAADDD